MEIYFWWRWAWYLKLSARVRCAFQFVYPTHKSLLSAALTINLIRSSQNMKPSAMWAEVTHRIMTENKLEIQNRCVTTDNENKNGFDDIE